MEGFHNGLPRLESGSHLVIFPLAHLACLRRLPELIGVSREPCHCADKHGSQHPGPSSTSGSSALATSATPIPPHLAILSLSRVYGSSSPASRHSTESWTGCDLNPRPLPCQDSDLPADLLARELAVRWSSVLRFPADLYGGADDYACTFGSGFFPVFAAGSMYSSSGRSFRIFSPGIGTGYSPVRQPRQRSARGCFRAVISPF